MNKRKVLFGIFGAILLLAGIALGGLALAGRFPGQGGNLYEDPQGRFTMQVGDWEQVETDGSYTHFKVENPSMDLYVLVLETTTVEDAFLQSMQTVGYDPGLLSKGSIATIGEWLAAGMEDDAGLSYGLAAQIVGDNAYVVLVKTGKPEVKVENSETMRVLESLNITGKQAVVMESYADLEAMVQKQFAHLAGSVSIALLHQDKIVYTYIYGDANPARGIPADTQSIYRFGSMTKPFTASALMQLVEQGLVDLDAWPGEYVPEFPKAWNVTVRQLLDHSACLPEGRSLTDGLIVKPEESFAPLEEIFTQYVKDNPNLGCEPGKASNYSNPHFLALARVIEEVSGEPYDTYVVDHLLIPLDMRSTRFEVVEPDERYAKGQYPTDRVDKLVDKIDEYRGTSNEDLVLYKGESFSTLDSFRVLPPWGGLFGTPSDVTHFLQMFMNGGRYGDVQILQPETVKAMLELQPSTDGAPLDFGLSWMIGENEFGKFAYHSGGGHTIETVMAFYSDLDLGVVVMGSVNGYQTEKIAAAAVSAWSHEK